MSKQEATATISLKDYDRFKQLEQDFNSLARSLEHNALFSVIEVTRTAWQREVKLYVGKEVDARLLREVEDLKIVALDQRKTIDALTEKCELLENKKWWQL